MSRYNGTTVDGKECAYGFDRVYGFFLQVFKPMEECDEDEGEILLVNLDSETNGLTGVSLVMACDKHGVPISEGHRFYAMLDLPI